MKRVPDISLEPTNPVFNALKVNVNNVVNNVNGYSRVINKFMDKYPNVTVEVLNNNGTILK